MHNTRTHCLSLSLSLTHTHTLLKTNVLFRLKSSEPGADKKENFFFIYSSIGKRKVLQKHGPLCILETTNFVRAICFLGFKVSLEFRPRLSCARIMIKLNGNEITSLKTINFLEVLFDFDSKMKWSPPVPLTLKKANKALNPIRLIKRSFSIGELLLLIIFEFTSGLNLQKLSFKNTKYNKIV